MGGLLFASSCIASTLVSAASSPDLQVPRVLRAMHDRCLYDHDIVVASGFLLYPAIKKILDGPLSPRDEARVYGVLASCKGNRRRFIQRATAALASPHARVRSAATFVVAQITSPAETILLFPLLSDDDRDVRVNAAFAIVEMGDHRAVQAFDVWLAVNRENEGGEMYKIVTDCRRQLQAQLEMRKLYAGWRMQVQTYMAKGSKLQITKPIAK